MDLEKAMATLKKYKMNVVDNDSYANAEFNEALNIAIDTMEFFHEIKLFCVKLLNDPEFVSKQKRMLGVENEKYGA